MTGDAAAMETAEHVGQAVVLCFYRRLVMGSGTDGWLAAVLAMKRTGVDGLPGTTRVQALLERLGDGRKIWRCALGHRNYSTQGKVGFRGDARSLHIRRPAWGICRGRRSLCIL